MFVSILAIGDEIISGKTVNTNASYIAKLLEANQLKILRHMAVRDDKNEIINGLANLFQVSDVVITTGGLGPTVDDLTKEAASIYFNENLVFFPKVYNKITAYFKRLNKDVTINNKKQAYFIEGSTILENNNGTAPGMIFEKMGKIIINLPGPPKELKPMLKEKVIPYLKSQNKIRGIKKEYRLMNIGESQAETLISPLYNKYPNIKIAPYASVGVVDYVILINDEKYKNDLERCSEEFEGLLKNYIIGDWSKNIQEIIVDLLREKSLTLAIAESCTGGMLTSSIVDISGSSQVLKEGMVTYSNQSKINRLGVKQNTLDLYGAVSKETAREMAEGIQRISDADIGLSVTGIAGPIGGTKTKPVGLVYSGIHFNGKTYIFKNNFNGDRYKIRLRSTMQILYELYKILSKTFSL